MLALDDGGSRGVVTLQILLRLERLLGRWYGQGGDFRLASFFDFVGGAGSGALIAAGIARGVPVRDLLRCYRSLVPTTFSSRLQDRCRSLYAPGPVLRALHSLYGEEARLASECLQTLALLVMRDAQGQACLMLSQPDALGVAVSPYTGFEGYLWQLARASLADDDFALPEPIQGASSEPGKVVSVCSGRATPYANPAFLMAQTAIASPSPIGWGRGERELLVVSVGAGTLPWGDQRDDVDPVPLTDAQRALRAMLAQTHRDQDRSCRVMGRCVHGPVVRPETGDRVPRDASGHRIALDRDLGRGFLYARYDEVLTRDWLRKVGLEDIDPLGIAALEGSLRVESLDRIGRALAESVELDHFGAFLDAPLWLEQSAGALEASA